jgi:CheY-like chemotaxis protein
VKATSHTFSTRHGSHPGALSSQSSNGHLANTSARATILAVEDDPAVAAMTRELLAELGYIVYVAHTASEALIKLSHQKVDLVFSDIVMPGAMNGIELARRVREQFPYLPVLLTTGYNGTAMRTRLEFPLILKPYKLDDLAMEIALLLGRYRSDDGHSGNDTRH